MRINNRLAQYTAGIFFLLACVLVWYTPKPHQSRDHKQPSRFSLRAATTNQSNSMGHQVRKISLEIILFSNNH